MLVLIVLVCGMEGLLVDCVMEWIVVFVCEVDVDVEVIWLEGVVYIVGMLGVIISLLFFVEDKVVVVDGFEVGIEDFFVDV